MATTKKTAKLSITGLLWGKSTIYTGLCVLKSHIIISKAFIFINYAHELYIFYSKQFLNGHFLNKHSVNVKIFFTLQVSIINGGCSKYLTACDSKVSVMHVLPTNCVWIWFHSFTLGHHQHQRVLSSVFAAGRLAFCLSVRPSVHSEWCYHCNYLRISAWNLVGWCTVPWSRSCKMLSQFLYVPQNLEFSTIGLDQEADSY